MSARRQSSARLADRIPPEIRRASSPPSGTFEAIWCPEETVDNAVRSIVEDPMGVDTACIDSSVRAVEVRVTWGDDYLWSVDHLTLPTTHAVVEATDASGTLATSRLVGPESLGIDRPSVVMESDATMALVISEASTGSVKWGDRHQTFQELIAAGELQPGSTLKGAHRFRLPPGGTASLQLRGLTFVVRPVAAAKRIGVEGCPRTQWRQHVWILASLLLHGACLLMFSLTPPKVHSLSFEPTDASSRLVKYVYVRRPLMMPGARLPGGRTDNANDHQRTDFADLAAEIEKWNRRHIARRFQDHGSIHFPYIAREYIEVRTATAAIISARNAATWRWRTPVLYDSRYDRLSVARADAFLDTYFGERIGVSAGQRAAHVDGVGGDEANFADVISGNLMPSAADCVRLGTGTATYGSQFCCAIAEPPHMGRVLTVGPHVDGQLSNQAIRSVVDPRLDEVGRCYQHALQDHPYLAGRVALRLIIAATGDVQYSMVLASNLIESSVEDCIAAAGRRWVFPPPGATVVVTYPFILRQTVW